MVDLIKLWIWDSVLAVFVLMLVAVSSVSVDTDTFELVMDSRLLSVVLIIIWLSCVLPGKVISRKVFRLLIKVVESIRMLSTVFVLFVDTS